MAQNLQFTGERVVPGATPMMLIWAHTARYQFVREGVRGKDVLDAGCGEGYGTYYLAQHARSTAGVDVAPESVVHAQAYYSRDNLRFAQMDISRLAFNDRSFDVVCSFEVIEHLSDIAHFVEEVRRVLRPGSTFYVSTPNAAVNPFPGCNPFHEKEFTLHEYFDVLHTTFPKVEIYGQFCLRRAREWVYLKSTRLYLHSQVYRRFANVVAPLYFSRAENDPQSDEAYWVDSVNPGTFAFRRRAVEQAPYFMAVCQFD